MLQEKGKQKKPNKKGRINESRGKKQKKSRKNKAQGQEVELEREVAAFELVVERETDSTYHLKKQLQKKK